MVFPCSTTAEKQVVRAMLHACVTTNATKLHRLSRKVRLWVRFNRKRLEKRRLEPRVTTMATICQSFTDIRGEPDGKHDSIRIRKMVQNSEDYYPSKIDVE